MPPSVEPLMLVVAWVCVSGLVAIARLHLMAEYMKASTVFVVVFTAVYAVSLLAGPNLAVQVCVAVILYAVMPFLIYTMDARTKLVLVMHLDLVFLVARLSVLVCRHLRGTAPYDGEGLSMALGKFLYSPLPKSREELAVFMAEEIIEMGVIMVGGVFTRRVMRHVLGDSITPAEDPFLVFSLFQCMIIGSSMIIGFTHLIDSPSYVIVTFILSVVCLITDSVVARAMLVLRREMAERSAVEARDRELRRVLAEYDALIPLSRHAARLRHDARNQLTLLSALIGRGESEAARRLIGELKDGYGPHDSPENHPGGALKVERPQ